ncbi:hypothetical protein [Candidatus Laterigemmans baculatus]|uniref:hypothetical protein n=1 Tax=Candidatus Laterigemmans baculatus TaxID=2770505 RepID=UPI0013D90F54|nr:hypothetical protein [Candidatus Laterigemmans baculatus]
MIHYTCDRCHRVIELDSEARYTVDIEAKAVFEPGPISSAADDDGDHLLELHELLERLDEEEEGGPEADLVRHHFDLCSDCFKVYARNPIARELPLSIEFSEN